MAIAALLLWMCTAAVGSYLLATSIRAASPEPAEPVPVRVRPAHGRERSDPPSLRRARSEPLPGTGALAEFAHPALAMIGLGFWIGYVASRDRLFAAIGLGIALGTIAAGMAWAAVNARAARRAAASGDDRKDGAGPLLISPRVLALHAAGAALTLLFAALIAARG